MKCVTKRRIIEDVRRAAMTIASHDVVVLFFSGHGERMDDTACVNDCAGCIVSVRKLQAVFAETVVKRVVRDVAFVVILDCCQTLSCGELLLDLWSLRIGMLTCVCVSVSVDMCVFACGCVWMRVAVCACVCICVCACVCVSVCLCLCVCVHVRVRVCGRACVLARAYMYVAAGCGTGMADPGDDRNELNLAVANAAECSWFVGFATSPST